jgi:hypothetical protein
MKQHVSRKVKEVLAGSISKFHQLLSSVPQAPRFDSPGVDPLARHLQRQFRSAVPLRIGCVATGGLISCSIPTNGGYFTYGYDMLYYVIQ